MKFPIYRGGLHCLACPPVGPYRVSTGKLYLPPLNFGGTSNQQHRGTIVVTPPSHPLEYVRLGWVRIGSGLGLRFIVGPGPRIQNLTENISQYSPLSGMCERNDFGARFFEMLGDGQIEEVIIVEGLETDEPALEEVWLHLLPLCRNLRSFFLNFEVGYFHYGAPLLLIFLANTTLEGVGPTVVATGRRPKSATESLSGIAYPLPRPRTTPSVPWTETIHQSTSRSSRFSYRRRGLSRSK